MMSARDTGSQWTVSVELSMSDTPRSDGAATGPVREPNRSQTLTHISFSNVCTELQG